MNKKFYPYILIFVLAVLLFFVKRATNHSANSTTRTSTQLDPATAKDPATEKDPASQNRDRGFDRRISFIEYTRHAKCRMQCRHITQKEVEQLMENGKINYNKSDVKARPCPEYALEGNTDDGQHVRIVYAQCDLKTKVVTVIDLNTEWECDCPGDDKKHQNNN